MVSPESTTASAGTTSVAGKSTGNSTSTNMPGLSTRRGFAASSRTFSVSVASSKLGSGGTDQKLSVILAVPDASAQKLFYAMENGEWTLVLRPIDGSAR